MTTIKQKKPFLHAIAVMSFYSLCPKDNKKNYPANVRINDTISYIFIIKHTCMIIEVNNFIEY